MTAALAETRTEPTPAQRLTGFLRDECSGRERALHLPELASCLDMDERDLQTAARAAREDGAPICSSSCGLWYSPEDARSTAWGLIRRGVIAGVWLDEKERALRLYPSPPPGAATPDAEETT